MFALEGLEKALANLLHALFGGLTDVAQTTGIVVEEARLAHLLFELSAHGLVVVAEDVAPEGLDLRDDVPRLIVLNVLHDVFQNPLEDEVGGGEVADELIDGEFLHLVVVESDAEVGGEVELARHVAEHTLEEGVDGFHPEVVVVVEQIIEGHGGSLANQLGIEACALLDGFKIAIGIGQLVGDAIELAEDTHLHLLGGLVGEGDGEDGAIALGILHEQSDIFCGKRKCLTTSGTGLIDC